MTIIIIVLLLGIFYQKDLSCIAVSTHQQLLLFI